MVTIDLHNLGTFTSLESVWTLYPFGGCDGDYVTLNGTVIYWNNVKRVWGDFKESVTPYPTSNLEGDLTVGGNINAGGTVTAAKGVFDSITVGSIVCKDPPYALKDHNHDERYALIKHTHELRDIPALADFISSHSGSGGSFSAALMWIALAQEGTEQIDRSHLTDLIEYVKTLISSSSSDPYWTLVTENGVSYIKTTYPVVSTGEITAYGTTSGGSGGGTGGSSTLNGLTDVDTTTNGLADGYILVWSAAASKWVVQANPGGGTGGTASVFDVTTNGLVPAPTAAYATTGYYLNGAHTWSAVYNHTQYTAKDTGMWKFSSDIYGHVTSATAVTYADIEALGFVNYWTLVTSTTDSLGNVIALEHPYIVTKYPVVSQGEITAFGTSSGGTSLKLSDLSDVDTSAIASGKVLAWNGTKWACVDMSGGTGTTYTLANFSSGYGFSLKNDTTGTYQYWTHPSYSSYSRAFLKVAVDSYGHVSSASSVSLSDLTSLGALSNCVISQSGNTITLTTYKGSTTSTSQVTVTDTDTNTTYSLSKSGSTITLSGSDGSTTSVTDNNTTYGRFSSSSDGLVPNTSSAGGHNFLATGGWSTVDGLSIGGSTYVPAYKYPPSSYGYIPCILSDGQLEIGSIIDFHLTPADGLDYNARILVSGSDSGHTFTFKSYYNTSQGAVANIVATGEITAYASSDRRLKKDIATIYNGIDLINKLNPVNFTWNNIAVGINSSKNETDLQAGLIAQDVLKVLPSIVHKQGDYLALDYIQLIPYMLSAIQYMYAELKSKII